MEKLSLYDAIIKERLDTSALFIETASKYTNNGDDYIHQYKKIGLKRKLIRSIILVLEAILVLVSLKYNFMGSFLILITSGIIAALLIAIYVFLLKEHSRLDGLDYAELENKIVNEVIDLHFKELYEFARNDKAILFEAFQSAKELKVDEARLETYIKGYIDNKLFNIDYEENSRNKKIEEVIMDYNKKHNK